MLARQIRSGADKMTRYECRTGRICMDMTTFWMLSKMGWLATKLYNTAMWNSRKVWEDSGKIPTGYDLQKVVLASPHHAMLAAHTYQHPAHQVGNAFKSWFKLRKNDTTTHPPGFRKKEKPSSFLFTRYGFKIIDQNTLSLTLTKPFKEQINYPHKRLTIKLRWSTPFPKEGVIQQIEVIPRKGYFEVHAKIMLPQPRWKTKGIVVAVDLGQKVPIAAVGEDQRLDLYKGGGIQSLKRYANKTKKRVAKEVMARTKGGKKWSKPLNRMSKKFNNQFKHSLHSLTTHFTRECVKRKTKEVVIGDLKNIKKEKDGTGKRWKKKGKAQQNWQQFPLRTLVAQLGYKLARHGIRLTEQDERGTSKGRCSICGYKDRKHIHRLHRGMFHCDNCNNTQHADINGAKNQLARYLHQETKVSAGSSGCLAQPLVHRWDNHNWSTIVAT